MWAFVKACFTHGRSAQSTRRRTASFRPALEEFEERWLPSTFIVTDSADASQAQVGSSNPQDTNGLVSLRSAVAAADVDAAKGHSDTIKFSPTLSGAILILTQGDIEIAAGKGTVTVNGGDNITLDETGSWSFFQCDDGSHSVIENMTLEDGYSEFGGAIFNNGSLCVENCNFQGNNAVVSGGAIYNGGKLTVANSQFYENGANYGGAICNEATLGVNESDFYSNYAAYDGALLSTSVASVCNSHFYNNVAYYDGGAIFNSGSMTVRKCEFDNNTSEYGNGGAIASEGDPYYRGGKEYNSAKLNLSSCSFDGNSALLGGAIYLDYSNISTGKSTFFGNSAGAGDNIFNGS